MISSPDFAREKNVQEGLKPPLNEHVRRFHKEKRLRLTVGISLREVTLAAASDTSTQTL
jgi:hypothetical protein